MCSSTERQLNGITNVHVDIGDPMGSRLGSRLYNLQPRRGSAASAARPVPLSFRCSCRVLSNAES